MLRAASAGLNFPPNPKVNITAAYPVRISQTDTRAGLSRGEGLY